MCVCVCVCFQQSDVFEVSSTTIDPIDHNYPKMELPEFSNFMDISLNPMSSETSSNVTDQLNMNNLLLAEPATVQPMVNDGFSSLWRSQSQIVENERNTKEKKPFSVTNQNECVGISIGSKGKSRLLVNMINFNN